MYQLQMMQNQYNAISGAMARNSRLQNNALTSMSMRNSCAVAGNCRVVRR